MLPFWKISQPRYLLECLLRRANTPQIPGFAQASWWALGAGSLAGFLGIQRVGLDCQAANPPCGKLGKSLPRKLSQSDQSAHLVALSQHQDPDSPFHRQQSRLSPTAFQGSLCWLPGPEAAQLLAAAATGIFAWEPMALCLGNSRGAGGQGRERS